MASTLEHVRSSSGDGGTPLKGLLSLLAVALLVWWVKESPAEAASAVRQGLEMLRQAAESVKTFLEALPSPSSFTSS